MMERNKPDLLNESVLRQRIQTECMGRILYYYEETDSTNSVAAGLADTDAPEGTLVVADAQTKGKGRRGRGWESPAGNSIYFSLLVRPEIPPDRASALTLVMALSVAQAVEKACGYGPPGTDCRGRGTDGDAILIKWPNDLVARGKKICGILTELRLEESHVKGVVIGVGINVNQQDSLAFPEQIREYAGSVRMAAKGRRQSRADLIADIMRIFETDYRAFLRTGDMTGLKAAYESRLANIGRAVKVLDPKGEYSGTARGINSRGELQVERADGTVVSVYAGEVSVRGLYGYA